VVGVGPDVVVAAAVVVGIEGVVGVDGVVRPDDVIGLGSVAVVGGDVMIVVGADDVEVVVPPATSGGADPSTLVVGEVSEVSPFVRDVCAPTEATIVPTASPEAATPTVPTACHASAVAPMVATSQRARVPTLRMAT